MIIIILMIVNNFVPYFAGDIVNQMMNDNWQDIFARLQPKMEEDMSKHSHQLLHDFFQTVAYDKIFPDI